MNNAATTKGAVRYWLGMQLLAIHLLFCFVPPTPSAALLFCSGTIEAAATSAVLSLILSNLPDR